ncbi:MAG: HAD hydrolase family protein [Bacteroidales bacterium]|nr:HAD hydrolase family protein [Bacteroidales bacterium]
MNYKTKLRDIKAFVFDFDGVMTDGAVWMYADKETVRAGNIKDGYAIQYAIKKGYIVTVISGATSLSIDNRMESLGAPKIYTGASNKLEVYRLFMKEHGLKREEVLYMGDDIPDYEVMKEAGVSCCPSDAATEIKEIADYISLYAGGQGCVRDVIEQTLRLHGKWLHPDAVNW